MPRRSSRAGAGASHRAAAEVARWFASERGNGTFLQPAHLQAIGPQPMPTSKRLVPSLAILSVGLTGCGGGTEGNAGTWDLTFMNDVGLPLETTYALTATGGPYDGYYSGYTYSISGSLTVSASGAASLTLNVDETEGYCPFSEEEESTFYSLHCAATTTGQFVEVEPRSFEIRLDGQTSVCENSEGEETEESADQKLNLDCVLHEDPVLLDCVDRDAGGYWAFERSKGG